MGPEIAIKLIDETSDKRFGDVNTAKEVIKAATETKTATTKGGTSDPGIEKFKNIGVKTLDSLTGGGFSMYTRLASQAGPMAVAMLALAWAKELHKQFRYNNQQLEVQEHMRLRAGGPNRGPVNVMNQRVNVFTRRSSGDYSTYLRR